MTLAGLDQLYRQVILDAAVDPTYRGQLTNATDAQAAHNPSCGDVLEVQAQIRNDQIVAVSFQGSGCTISQASASLMAELVANQSINSVEKAIKQFKAMILGQEADLDQLGDAGVFSSISQFPTRVKCAALAWDALDELLKNQRS
ncbi:SUF system NifU family Fe-S cluster assembly protein [Oenococcus sicerae]|uniref:SUF system NifU family Fe-S cluster assembly protein n=1 Tax=Oenococcus sicerae TaxID=2203724 RepID=A0AAJ1VN48_9LACO|nr:SUF system NifU family Fe-S cluster assembly protein [Oenococcus sicerae]MDN6899839.1 SUF system NifU family Fe-S cluster assembly protein [Oenococcus sicerae]QAS70524.1 SUF system NifU family Fe-S cluster assembly protein [Oenococcus sicerae]